MPVQEVKKEGQSDPVGRIAAGYRVVALPRLLTQSGPPVWYERHGSVVVSQQRLPYLGAKGVVMGRMPAYTCPGRQKTRWKECVRVSMSEQRRPAKEAT